MVLACYLGFQDSGHIFAGRIRVKSAQLEGVTSNTHTVNID